MNKKTELPAQYQTGFLADLDGRTEIARVMRERWENLTADLGGAVIPPEIRSSYK